MQTSDTLFRQRLDDIDARIRRARAGCPANRIAEADALEARSAALRDRAGAEAGGDDDGGIKRDWDDLVQSVEHWIETVGREDGLR